MIPMKKNEKKREKKQRIEKEFQTLTNYIADKSYKIRKQLRHKTI